MSLKIQRLVEQHDFVQNKIFLMSKEFDVLHRDHAQKCRTGSHQAAKSLQTRISFLCEQLGRYTAQFNILQSALKEESKPIQQPIQQCIQQTTKQHVQPIKLKAETSCNVDSSELQDITLDNICNIFGFSDTLNDLLYAPYCEWALLQSLKTVEKNISETYNKAEEIQDLFLQEIEQR